MAYLDQFPLDQDMTIRRRVQVKDPVTGEISEVTYPVGGAKVFWWQGGGYEGLVSERLRSIVTGIVIAKPGVDVLKDDELSLSDGNRYRALGVDNIAMRDDVVMIPVAVYG